MKMTRSELVDRIVECNPHLSREDVDACVRALLAAMSSHLSSGGRIEIRGFGSFGLRARAAKLGRNPRTGTPVHVPAKVVPFFKAGGKLREGVMERDEE
jgi:integration host factor subunit beta